MENIFGLAKKLSDRFFDGLKNNMTNRALAKTKKNKSERLPIIERMSQLDKASKEIDQMLKDLGEK